MSRGLIFDNHRFHADHVVIWFGLTILFTLLFAVGAILPLAVIRWCTAKVTSHTLFFYTGAGAIAGLVAGPLLGPMIPSLATTGIPEVAFWPGYMEALQSSGLLFFLTGAIGGFVYGTVSRLEKRA